MIKNILHTSMQTYIYKKTSQCELKADVYRPGNEEMYPVIVWLHGGALVSGNRQGLPQDQCELYLQTGYIVASIDYRLAPETKLTHIVEDVKGAFSWVRNKGTELFGADPNRIAAVGHSAGGYLALMAGFHVMPRPKVLVSVYGYGDIAGAWYSKPDPYYCSQPEISKLEAYQAIGSTEVPGTTSKHRGKFYVYCRQHGYWPREITGHDPYNEPEAFDRLCPERNVTGDYPPTLLVHGEQDTDVPYDLSVSMAGQLKQAGVKHEFITIPKGPHMFDTVGLQDPEVGQTFEQVVRFLKQHL